MDKLTELLNAIEWHDLETDPPGEDIDERMVLIYREDCQGNDVIEIAKWSGYSFMTHDYDDCDSWSGPVKWVKKWAII